MEAYMYAIGSLPVYIDDICTAPLEEITPHIHRLWKACLTDAQIVQELQKHFDTSQYGLA